VIRICKNKDREKSGGNKPGRARMTVAVMEKRDLWAHGRCALHVEARGKNYELGFMKWSKGCVRLRRS
jgi:hypothetical protein